MNKTIHITLADGRTVDAPIRAGATLAQTVFLHRDTPDRALCTGLGRCGKCRVRFVTEPPKPVSDELRVFGEEGVARGWRLACRHAALDGMRVELEADGAAKRVELQAAVSAKKGGEPLLLAVDLGTTGVQWAALRGGETVARGGQLNPQMGAGSEVMSRLAFAAMGAERAGLLRDLARDLLREVSASLLDMGANFGPVSGICVAGNTVMTHFLLGLPTRGLATAPYRLDCKGGTWETLAADLPPVYIPPQFGPFVGGDLSAGLAWLLHGGAGEVEYPFLLADMGTNGECILALSPERFLAASVALGPALEGIGLGCGSVAGSGVATAFRLSLAGMEPLVLGEDTSKAPQVAARDEAVRGISGTGYLSLVRVLLKAGVLREDGLFTPVDQASGLARRVLGRLHTPGARAVEPEHGKEAGADKQAAVGEPRLDLGHGVFLDGGDVESLLKVKAAFNVALEQLLRKGETTMASLKAVYLAGALGEHTTPTDLEALGFLPPGGAKLVRGVGNSSLAGASLLVSDEATRVEAERLACYVELVELAGHAWFSDAFLRSMEFFYVRTR